MSAEAIGPSLLASCMAVAVASLLGSVHCAGMCGGLSACATPMASAKRVGAATSTSTSVRLTTSIGPARSLSSSLLGMQTAYHGARLLGYAALGAAAGALGAALDLGGSLVGVQRIASLMAGATIAVLGAIMLLRIAGVRVPSLFSPAAVSGRLARAFSSLHQRAVRWPPLVRALAIGGITPLLPCGWLYAFVAIAAGAGGVLGGASVMAAFWIGTVPALIAVAAGVRLALRFGATPLGRGLPIVAALLMIGVGLHLGFVRGPKAAIVASLVHPVAHASSDGYTATNLSAAIEHVGDELPACCEEGTDP
jgi:uncharacterized protein